MKIKDLINIIENFKDEDEVAIEIDEELHECIAYEDPSSNELGITTLVIGLEYIEVSENNFSMRFYEFSSKDFGYYALIGAATQEKAIEFYQEVVCDIEGENNIPSELTKEGAKLKLMNICRNSKQKKEANKSFEENIIQEEPYLILLDSGLL